MHFTGEEISRLMPLTEKRSGIYKIENLVNHKVYIGQAVDVHRRIKKHFWDTENGNSKMMHQDICKYGIENFKADVLEYCPEDELYEKEREYIEKYNSYLNGYNLRKGGRENEGWIVPTETREKSRENNLGGRSHFARITVCDGIEFECAKECARHFNIPYACIKDWLSHKAKMPKEWFDRGLHYKDEPIEMYQVQKDKRIRVVWDDIVYPSIRSFCKELNIDRGLIRKIRAGEKPIPEEWVKHNYKLITE